MESINEIFDREFKGIDNIEPLLSLLRSKGVSQIDTIALLKRKTKLPLKELDLLVLNSETWKDARDANISIRNSFLDNLD